MNSEIPPKRGTGVLYFEGWGLLALTPTYSFRSPTRVGQNRAHSLVILSVSEGSHALGTEILRCAQNDTGEPIRLFLSDELMEQYVGINAA